MNNICPICQEPPYTTIRNLHCESKCKNGHVWHTCLKHGVQVLGHAPKPIEFIQDYYKCTCSNKIINNIIN